jgi:copper resistance protein C
MKRILLCLLLTLTAGPAFAHAHLQKSIPAAGAKIRSPLHIVLNFSEALEPAYSGALVMNADGRNFSAGPMVVDGPVMTLTPGHLAPGVYRVVWHSVGHDTHRLDGEFSFTVKP